MSISAWTPPLTLKSYHCPYSALGSEASQASLASGPGSSGAPDRSSPLTSPLGGWRHCFSFFRPRSLKSALFLRCFSFRALLSKGILSLIASTPSPRPSYFKLPASATWMPSWPPVESFWSHLSDTGAAPLPPLPPYALPLPQGACSPIETSVCCSLCLEVFPLCICLEHLLSSYTNPFLVRSFLIILMKIENNLLP